MPEDNNYLSKNTKRRNILLLLATLIFSVFASAYGCYYFLILSQQAETDNAYVGGNLVILTAQVEGNVQEIHADETQMVKADAELIKLDPIDADVALRQAEAKLASTVLEINGRYTSLHQYEALIKQKEIDLQQAHTDLARRLPLAKDHTIAAEEISHYQQAVADAQAALSVIKKQTNTVQAGLGNTTVEEQPEIQEAKANFIKAWLAVRRNSIIAPISGYVAKRGVQIGEHVVLGTPLMSIVPLDQLWIDANFKESELQNIRVNQPVKIEADAYGSKVEYHGKVIGLSVGTGSAFSLLPAQNASGNWVKVVQRLPVRIALDAKELAQHPLRIGLSTIVTIDTHQRSGAVLGSPMPSSAIYSTQAFKQPLEKANQMANTIISKNLNGNS